MKIPVPDTIVLRCSTQLSRDEVQHKSHIWDRLLSVATTYSYTNDRYKMWSFSKKDDLLKYLDGNLIVCYNGVNFDFPLLLGQDCKVSDSYKITSDVHKFNCVCVDLFYIIMESVYGVSNYNAVLNKLCKNPMPNKQSYYMSNIVSNSTGCLNIDNDSKTVEMFKTKKILELIECNLSVLRNVKKLYDFMVTHKYVVNGDFDIVRVKDINEWVSDWDMPF